MIDLKGKSIEELKELIIGLGEKPYRANQVFKWLYCHRASSISEMTDLGKTLRDSLNKKTYISKIKTAGVYESKKKDTKKYLFCLEDGQLIESVLMRYEEDLGIGRVTVCLSTQVGCRFGCKFCASGKAGFVRNLTSAEIVDQVLTIQEDVKSSEERVSNIVFMGMGEPLDNYENLIKAVKIITNPEGISIGKKHISISTCGLPDKILKLAEEKIGIKLALSLHAADNIKRTSVIPINKKYPLEVLFKALKKYQVTTRDKIVFEYALVKGFNDSDEDIRNLTKLLKGINSVINIIPINIVEGFAGTYPSEEEIKEFAYKLKDKGMIVTVRKSRGEDIQAACGQLRYHHLNPSSNKFDH